MIQTYLKQSHLGRVSTDELRQGCSSFQFAHTASQDSIIDQQIWTTPDMKSSSNSLQYLNPPSFLWGIFFLFDSWLANIDRCTGVPLLQKTYPKPKVQTLLKLHLVRETQVNQCPWYVCHRENGGTLGMVALIINPILRLRYSGYLLGISLLKASGG